MMLTTKQKLQIARFDLASHSLRELCSELGDAHKHLLKRLLVEENTVATEDWKHHHQTHLRESLKRAVSLLERIETTPRKEENNE